MHNRSAHQTEATALGGRYVDVHYDNIVAEVSAGLSDAVHLAQITGIADERILVDPGVASGKPPRKTFNNKHLARLRELGHPILLGISRKSFIGYTHRTFPWTSAREDSGHNAGHLRRRRREGPRRARHSSARPLCWTRFAPAVTLITS